MGMGILVWFNLTKLREWLYILIIYMFAHADCQDSNTTLNNHKLSVFLSSELGFEILAVCVVYTQICIPNLKSLTILIAENCVFIQTHLDELTWLDVL